MNVIRLDSRRLPGCGERCFGLRHDPYAHEAYGMMLAFAPGLPGKVKTGPLVVDLVARSVIVGDRPIWLSVREIGILAYLARHVGQWCGVGDMLEEVWGTGYRETGRQAFRVRLSCLRKKLGVAGSLIETRNKLGYRLLEVAA